MSMTYKPQPGDAQRFLDSFLGKEAVSMTDDETGRALQRRVDEAGQAYSDAMVALLQHLVGLAKVEKSEPIEPEVARIVVSEALRGIDKLYSIPNPRRFWPVMVDEHAPVDEHARIWGLGTVNHVGGPLVVGCRDAYRNAPTPKAVGVYPDHTEAEYADWVRRQWPAAEPDIAELAAEASRDSGGLGATAAATLPLSDPNAPKKPANEGLFRAIGGKK